MRMYFEYSEEIREALHSKKPIVALESTVITHGLPHPHNIETAIAMETIVRQEGAIPATIALIHGKIKIGLSQDELVYLAEDKHTFKASSRDLAYVISQGLSAGTTVAATLFCAAACGIKIFATGGIGGVHRGDDQDISADLIELGRTPVAVICAGAKAILDLPRTLEFLETLSVPIIGYRTDTLPAFYSTSTQYKLPARADDIKTLANIITTHWQLGLSSGILITNPISSADAISADLIEPIIADAIKLAEKNNITGKAITPFLLSEVAKATQGKSLKANIALLKSNARLGAQLACWEGVQR